MRLGDPEHCAIETGHCGEAVERSRDARSAESRELVEAIRSTVSAASAPAPGTAMMRCPVWRRSHAPSALRAGCNTGVVKLPWDGQLNARDLGGIPLTSGGFTRQGVIARSEHPSFLTDDGWRQVQAYGVRTIISLETGGLAGEAALRANRKVSLPEFFAPEVISAPIEDGADAEFMQTWATSGLWGTPLYYPYVLDRWPELHGAAIRAIAESEATVLIHCGRGHDRTGIISMILLTIAGAPPTAVTADYLLSGQSLLKRDPNAVTNLAAALESAGKTAREAIGEAMDVLTPEYFERAGVGTATLQRLRTLMIEAGPVVDA